ncbi:xanthine dehydrogenase [Rhodopseudomonas palustris]|uniref:Xanthine dehydrogenase n=1 Tax=Rhodopseudomonas palustris (strain BisB18) TaxID=316056 RepID=Q20XY6_RHOPB
MHRPADHRKKRFAIVLGTNEVASAVAVYLHRADFGVVLSNDPDFPVIRRKMAFADALYRDDVKVEEVRGERADDGMQVFKGLRTFDRVSVTRLGLADLLPVGAMDVLVDARLQQHRTTPDLHRLAKLTIGIGAGFSGSTNCDVAVDAPPERCAGVLHDGWTAGATSADAAEAANQRFGYAPSAGRWRTAVEIGAPVLRGAVLGLLTGNPHRAPCDGVVRGLIRDDSDVPAGARLLEIDPRGRHAQWTGIDERGRSIAKAVLDAVQLRSERPRALIAAAASHPAV